MKSDDQPLLPAKYAVSHDSVDLESASKLSGMHPEMILEFMRADLVTVARTDRSGNPQFDDEAVFRLRRIEYLRTEQQTHLRTIRLILQLTDRAETAERELRCLRDRIR